MKLWPFGRFFRETRHPALEQADRYFSTFDPNRDVGDYEFVVLDSELTGLNERTDEIVSIAAVRIRNLHIVLHEPFHSYLKTRRRTFTQGTFIHQITPQKIQAAPDPKIVIPAFVEFCGTAILVGNFVSIDLDFLNRSSEHILGGKLPNPCLDTMELARVLREKQIKKEQADAKEAFSCRLNDLAREFGLPIFPAHDALSDAIQTAYLFLFLVEKLRGERFTSFADFSIARVDRNYHPIPAF